MVYPADMERGINDHALADRFALGGHRLVVQHLEAVSRVDVALEVDVMRENVDQGGHQGMRHAGMLARFIKVSCGFHRARPGGDG